MIAVQTRIYSLTLFLGFLILQACHSPIQDSIPELLLLDALNPPAYSLGGTISGLEGSRTKLTGEISPSPLSLKSARTEEVDLNAGISDYLYSEKVYTGESYKTRVMDHPRNPTEYCEISNATGTVENTDLTNLDLSCQGAYRLLTNISGVKNAGLTLISSQGDLLSVQSDGTVEFPTPFILSNPYQATIQSDPTEPWQTCQFADGTRTQSGNNTSQNDLTISSIVCVTNQYPITANVSGLVNDGLILNLNGVSTEIPGNSTSYSLGQVASGSSYEVTLGQNPVGQQCNLFSSSGSITNAGQAVEVGCTQYGYMVGGSLSNYTGSGLTLTLSGTHSETRTITAGRTGYYFNTTFNHGDTYSMLISTQPTNPWQTCSIIQKNSGSISQSTGSVTDASIVCTTNIYNLSGSISGLSYDGLVLNLNGTNYPFAAGTTSIALGNLSSGTVYNVTVQTQPSYQTCSVTNGSGTVGGTDISNIQISCNYNNYNLQANISGLVNGEQVTIVDPTYGTVSKGIGTQVQLYSLIHLSNYALAVSASGYTCSISGGQSGTGSGQVFGADVSNLSIICNPISYPFSGTIGGLVNGDTVLVQSGTGASYTGGNLIPAPFFSLPHGSDYAIVATAPGYNCSVTGGANGDGTGRTDIAAVTTITVACSPIIYSLQGTVSGLTISGDQVPLNIDIAGDTSNSGNYNNGNLGPYSIRHGDSYSITVASIPAGYNLCSVTNGSGTVNGMAPAVFTVICTPQSYPIYYTVATYDPGNTSTGNLQVGTLNQTINSSVGTAALIGNLTRGSDYSVTITNPSYQNCSTSNTGGLAISNSYTVNLSCNNTLFKIDLSVDGLSASESITFQNNGGNNQTVNYVDGSGDPGNFGYLSGSYMISILTQPSGKICAIQGLHYGTLSASITVKATCVTGYYSGGNYQLIPPAPLDYGFYRGNITTIAGQTNTTGNVDNATGTVAKFDHPEKLVYLNNNLYVADYTNHVIRVVATTGTFGVSTLTSSTAASGDSSDDGICSAARFDFITDIATDGTNLYVAEWNRGRIRKISDPASAGCLVTTLAGNGTLAYTDGTLGSALFSNIFSLAADSNYLYIADSGNLRIRRINFSTGVVDTIAGDGTAASLDSSIGTSASFNNPTALTIVGTDLYVSQYSTHSIRKISLSGNFPVTTIAGSATAGMIDSAGTNARFNTVMDMATDGTDLYLADFYNNRIRRVDLRNGYRVTTIAGNGVGSSVNGQGYLASLNNPHGIATDGRVFYVADFGSHTIRKLVDSGLVGYWPLNGSSIDYSSAGSSSPNDGYFGFDNTDTSTFPTATAGPYNSAAGEAFLFDGSSDFISINSSADTGSFSTVPPAQEFSIAVWVKATAGASGQNDILGNRSGSSGYDYSIIYENDSSTVPGQVSFARFDGTNNPVCRSGIRIDDGYFHHIVGESTTGYLRLYVDGKLVCQTTDSFATTITGGDLLIGSRNGSGYFFRGTISDVRLYKRALDEGEIHTLAQNALGVTTVGPNFSTGPTGLLDHFTFDGATAGGTVTDRGPMQANLSPGSSPVPAPFGRDGDANGAYSYDGASQYHTSAALSSEGYENGSSMSIAAWVKPDTLPTTNGDFWIIASRYSGAGAGFFAGIRKNSSTGIQEIFWSPNGGSGYYSTPLTLPLHAWSHLVFSLDHTASCGSASTIYVNGAATTVTPAGGSCVASVATTGSQLFVAKRTDGYWLDGSVDDVRIYNQTIDATQARSLACSGLHGSPDGCLSGGTILEDNTAGGSGNDVGKTVAISKLASNEIAVGGYSTSSIMPLGTIWKYKIDGKPDTGFSGTGQLVLPASFCSTYTASTINSIVFDASDSLAFTGMTATTNDFAARYDSTGTQQNCHVDPSGLASGGNSITIDSAGNFLTAGYIYLSSDYQYSLWKYGSTLGSPANGVINPNASNADYGNALAIDSSGNLFTGGNGGVSGIYDVNIIKTPWPISTPTATALDRITGTANSNDFLKGLAIDSSDRILAVGYGQNGGTATSADAYLLRLNNDLSLDTTFGTGGIVVLQDLSGVANSADYANAVAIDSTGKILVAGSTAYSGTAYRFFVCRFLTDGSRDFTFGNGDGIIDGCYIGGDLAGAVANSGTSSDGAYGIAIDSNDRIVITGDSFNGTNKDMFVMRLLP